MADLNTRTEGVLLTVTSERGGVGVSTLAQSLAVAHHMRTRESVVLLEASPHQVANNWSMLRSWAKLPSVPTVQLTKGADLDAALDTLTQKFDLVVLDAGALTSGDFETMALRSAICLVPLLPAGAAESAQLHLQRYGSAPYEEGLANTRFVLNRATPGSDSKLRERLVAAYGESISICAASVGQRMAYLRAQAQGATVVDIRGSQRNDKAGFEIMSLYAELSGPGGFADLSGPLLRYAETAPG